MRLRFIQHLPEYPAAGCGDEPSTMIVLGEWTNHSLPAEFKTPQEGAGFIAAAAITLDGRIAAYTGQNSAWTSREDKRFLHQFLDQCDVILVGRTTYETAIKPLSKRNCIILTSKVRKSLQKTPQALFLNPKSVNLLECIKKLGYKKVAVLGGRKVYSFCLEHGLLDELYLTIEPIVFGRGLNLFELKRLKQLRNKFKLVGSRKLNNRGSILLHYKLER